MGAFVFHGEIGSGKTYAGTAMAFWLVRQGRRVAHNWDISWPKEYRHLAVKFSEFGELFGMEDVDILADEAQNSAGARDWEAMPKKVRNWLSQHRHFGNNLLFFTQHYKFVDVYIRRLAPKGVWHVFRVLNLTLAMPNPEANPETGEMGNHEILGSRLFVRPWKDLDHPNPIGGFFALAKLSRLVPLLYNTRDKSTTMELEKAKKISPDAAEAGCASPSAASPTPEHPKLPLK